MRLKYLSRLKSSRQFSRPGGRTTTLPRAMVLTSNQRLGELAYFRF